MQRISSNKTNDDLQFHLRQREFQMNSVQNRMGDQTRLQNLRDDPVAASHAVRLASFAGRLDRFEDNIQTIQERHTLAENHLRESVEIVQRIRELAVQGANGTYTPDDMRAMAGEINALLEQFIATANARDGEGAAVFGGTKTLQEPFRPVRGAVSGADGQLVMQVEYLGNISQNRGEISDGTLVSANLPGNRVFWAETQQVFGAGDVQAYQVPKDTSIYVDGVEIPLKAGDNIHAVIARINDSDAAVNARLDPVQNTLDLQSTTPHQIWLRDQAGSTVLRDLGILDADQTTPPHNLAAGARSFGGSAFDTVISLRDMFLKGDQVDIGGRGLAGIDQALGNMLSSLGEIGAQGKRLEIARGRVAREFTDVSAAHSRLVDLDITEAVTELGMLEHAHKAALGAAGKILQPTLLDFLR